MAQSLAGNFKIYDDYFNSGFNETLQQNTQAFNGASNGGIVLVPQSRIGHYAYENFFDVVSTLVQRRDITSTSTASDTAMTQDEIISVKLARKLGPIGISLDAMKKQGRDPETISYIVGQQSAVAIQTDYLNTALLALRGAMIDQTALTHDATDGTIETADEVTGISKFGDAADRIVCWVMHSKVYFDLVKDQLGDSLWTGTGVRVLEGVASTFSRPVVVTDSASLKVANGVSTGVDAYYTFGLVAGGVRIEESEPATVVSQLITGYENIYYRVQGEHAFNLGLKGLKWDTGNGLANPTDATLIVTGNWDKAVTSDKLLPGIMIKSR